MSVLSVDVDKPPYRIPSMVEINDIPYNGYTVASTFSGGGGSCLGYRWAGFKVLYANEFVPESRLTYAANFPDTYLDPADIRDVTGADLLKRAGVERGELDILDGSPPCQSFSTAGKREKGWGIAHAHGDGSHQVSDDLFFEYARLLTAVQPRTFVAENVSGLVKGTAKGYFKEILKALKAAGYQVSARLLDAQWLGVPQARQRIIIVGVRNDLGLKPVHPRPLPYRYSLRDALAPEFYVTDGVEYQHGPKATIGRTGSDEPVRTAMATGMGGVREFQATILGRVMSDPETGQSLAPSPSRAVPGDNYGAALVPLDKPSPTVLSDGQNLVHLGPYDETLSVRYQYGTAGRERVHPDDQPVWTVTAEGMGGVPKHSVSMLGSEMVADPETGQSLVPIKSRLVGETDVVLGVTHRRKFTLGELRRLCGFPDDYVLVGTYTQRWARLGNAVPPPMMRSVAETIRDDILRVVDEAKQ